MVDMLRQGVATTRKVHRYYGCNLGIPKGADAFSVVLVDMGRAFTIYWCMRCEIESIVNGPGVIDAIDSLVVQATKYIKEQGDARSGHLTPWE